MIYRIAKQLKDIGFPQEGRGRCVDVTEDGVTYKLYYPTDDELAKYIIDNLKK